MFSLQLHKQQSRGELSRHTWHRQESDESSDSVPDEVRSEPIPHCRNFPRSYTYPVAVPSPSAIPASAARSTSFGQEVTSSHSSTQRRQSGLTTGMVHMSVLSYWTFGTFFNMNFALYYFFLLFRLLCGWGQSSQDGPCTNGWMGREQPSNTTSPWPCTRGELRGWKASPRPQGKSVLLEFVDFCKIILVVLSKIFLFVLF